MTPDTFKTALAVKLGTQQVGDNTEVEVGVMREVLGMRGKPSVPRAQWAEEVGLRVVATRAARKGFNVWVRVGDVCRELDYEGSALQRAVLRSKHMQKAKTNGHHVRMSEPPTLDETPQIEVSELYEGPPVVTMRDTGDTKHRLDDMAARLNNLQQCAKANALRLRRIDRKINAMLKAWGIEDTPTEQDALEAALTELVNDGKED